MKKHSDFSKISGSVTAPRGFRAAGISAGIKKTAKPDLALIVSDTPAVAAATFTTNQVKAAPVRLSMKHIGGGNIHAIIANSGNANACTGEIGDIHARAMATATARRLGCAEEQVLVCSTGRIGVLLPIVKVESGIKKIIPHLSRKGDHDAARAIMTSDTRPKEVAVALKLAGTTIRIGGIAKGAGMIHPNMATMLAFITTDAAIPQATLSQMTSHAVEQSFNRISVDGDMSTNDTVIVLANGAAGNKPLKGITARIFQDALNHVCLELAKMIVRDGERVTRFVTLNVTGATTDRDAERAARAVANSLLVKCSWYGGDPNWGRLMDAIGYSGAAISEGRVMIAYNGVPAVIGGQAAKKGMARIRKIVARREFEIEINLGLGKGACTLYCSDLTEGYVDYNKGE
jgi:glutamate N-acetyltransferase/amino-acid N-acetyltransferase